MSDLVGSLVRALLATIVIECAAYALIFRVRDASSFTKLALAQVVTNPLVNLGVRFLPRLGLPFCFVVAALELGAFVVEALLYKRTQLHEHAWLVSLVLNALSFGLGALAWLL